MFILEIDSYFIGQLASEEKMKEINPVLSNVKVNDGLISFIFSSLANWPIK